MSLTSWCHRDGLGPRYTLVVAAVMVLMLGVLEGQETAPAEGRRPLCHVTVSEQARSDTAPAHLTFGVPLPDGAVDEAAALRVWRADDGRALPSQARALVHWPSGAVKWALMDAQLDLHARESLRLAVGLAEDIEAAPVTWTLSTEDDTAVTLSEGERTTMLLRRRPDADPRGDDVLDLRARLLDVLGQTHAARVAWTEDPPYVEVGEPLRRAGPVEILEWGPLRVCARIRGTLRPVKDGEGLDPFHTFTAYVHVLSGAGQARVEWSLENGALENPTGPLGFRRLELLTDGPPSPTRVDVAGREAAGDAGFSVVQTGDPSTSVFRVGDRPLKGSVSGDLNGGLASADGGVWVNMVASAENHPSALEWGPGGPLRLGLLPQIEGTPYWLDDATRKTFRVDVLRDVADGGARIAALATPPAVTLDAHDVAASRAWGDLGLIVVPSPREMQRPVRTRGGGPTGWADWGETVKNTHQTGSPRNRLSVYLEAVQSGRADLYDAAQSRAWHAMDMRPYHILGFTAEYNHRANLYSGTPHPNNSPQNKLGRKEMWSRHTEYRAGLPGKGHGYNGFDPEHMTLDDVYECYLLTGSWPAKSAMRSAGEAMLTWRWVMLFLHTARSTGWTLRALVQCYRATGDERYLLAGRRMVDLAEEDRGKGEVKYFHRNKKDNRHIANAESESPWMVAVAMYGLSAYWSETGDERVPPMLADLTAFVLAGFRGGSGFVADIPVDGPLDYGVARQAAGTSQWIPGAIATAAFVTGNHDPVDRVYPYHVAMRDHADGHARYGATSWHWWQPYLASLEQRYGSRALTDPRFRPGPPDR